MEFDCIYVFAALLYTMIGLTYGYLLWRILEVVDAYVRRLDT